MRDVRAHAWSPVVLVALCVILGLQGQAQQQAPQASDLLQELIARDSQVSVTWNERENIPRSVIGRLTQSSGASARQVALEFVRRNGSLFGLVDPERELQLVREESDRLGITHLRFAQIHEGVPVFGSEMRVHVNAAGIVSGVQAELLPGITVSAEPGIGPEVGLQMARSHAGDSAARGASTLVIFDRGRLPRGPRQDRLAWQVTLRSGPAGEWVYFVDAVDGNVLFRYTTRHDARFRVVYSYHMGAECDLGQLLYVENGPVVPNPGQAATSAHQFTGDFYDYYWSTHGRDGYDDAGSHMVSVVGLASGAAYYSPGCEATYYENAYVTKDVVAHEWQHAVTQFTANLVFSCEPGALNESMSDVFAAMVDRDDWLIGEDLPGGYIRSLADPTASQQPQPDTTSGFNPCAGVHHNSGIPNKVAYLVAEGGTHYGVVVTGVGRDRLEAIWYRALRFHMGPNTDLAGARDATLLAASALYGSGSGEICAVQSAWASVAVGQPCPTPPPPPPPGHTVSLRALNAQHVVAEGGGGGIVNANRDWIGPWETFTLVDLNGGTLWDGDPVAFRAENGQYLQAVDGGGGTMLAIGGGPWAHETFTILNLSNPGQPIGHEDVVALQSWGGWYVVAEGGGGDVVNANRTAIGAWEQFWVVFH